MRRLIFALFLSPFAIAASSLNAQECSRSEYELPDTYFAREPGVERHFSGALKIGGKLLVRTTSSSKKYAGTRMMEGVSTECISARLSITQFGETHERDASFYYLVDEDGISEFSADIGGEYLSDESSEGDGWILRGPLVENNAWSGTSEDFIILAGDVFVEEMTYVKTVVATGQVVEVEGGRFECCVVTRAVGITEEPLQVPGFFGAEPCSAFIEVSIEKTYAPGMGSILSERRERAFPVSYPDSVLVDSLYRSELVGIDRE